jgi:hypothetical protein
MALEGDLDSQFRRIGGWHYFLLDQNYQLTIFADRYAANHLYAKKGKKTPRFGGVCWELCRQWVRARIALGHAPQRGSTLGALASGANVGWGEDTFFRRWFMFVQGQSKRQEIGVSANYSVAGLKHDTTTRNRLFSWGLSRDDIINQVYGTHGGYILGFSGTAQARCGHAIAFHTSGGEIRFMDPNVGEFWVTTPDDNAKQAFRAWYRALWDKKYSRDYHKGARELTRYYR